MIQEVKNRIEAVIFDMDGVIIDSEDIWRKAENEVFSSVGVKLSDELCAITRSMTTTEVTKFWFERNPWESRSLNEVENRVVERVAQLIQTEGQAISGIREFIKSLKSGGFKIGLATNSPSVLIPIVLEKLDLTHYFDATSSAEHEPEGKPNPQVYLTTAEKLNVRPEHCLAIEDSHSGLLAAKKAGMKAVVVDTNNLYNNEIEIADFKINDYDKFDFSFLL